MSDQKFSIGEAITFGWEITKQNLGFLIGFLIVATIIQYLPSLLADRAKDIVVLSFLLQLVAWVVQMIVAMGFLRMALKFHQGGKGEWSDLYASYPLALKYIGGSILYGLIVFVGTLLLIIPGIIFAIKYQYYGYLIVDQNLGPVEAIKKSGSMTKGNLLNLFLFGLVMALVTLLGALCLLVGLFIAIPVVLLASAHVYRKLLVADSGTTV